MATNPEHGANTPHELRWIEETLRLNQRYTEEVVERLQLCPWAKSAREASRVVRHVHLERRGQLDAVLSTLASWSELDGPEVGLLLFPRNDSSSRGFQLFTNRLIEADRARWGRRSSPFAMAAFHPDADCDTSNADRLVPYLRRTPDPTVQVVWIRALERVRGQEVSGTLFVDFAHFSLAALPTPTETLRERIARRNLATVRQREHELSRVLRDILEDREQTHARLEREAPLIDSAEEHPAGSE